MTADVIQDRRVTEPAPGLHPAFVDWSRLYWALPSRIRGPRSARDRIQGDAALAACFLGPLQDQGVLPRIARPLSSRLLNSRAVLAAGKAWPGNDAACDLDTATASLACSCARRVRTSRVGTKKRLQVEQRNCLKENIPSARLTSLLTIPIQGAGLKPALAQQIRAESAHRW